MKKLITIISARISFLVLMVCFACIGIRSSADTVDPPILLGSTSTTSSGFTFRSLKVTNATEYFLDLATDSAFTHFVIGYNNDNLGSSPGHTFTGLSPNTKYYYRMRASDGTTTSSNSNIESTTTLKASATVALGSLTQTYTGSALNATATTTPTGLSVTFTYNGSSTAPTNVGTYSVTGTIVDSTYTGSHSGTMTIGKATATVSLSNLTSSYDGSSHGATVTTTPNGLTVNVTYNGSSTVPTAIGTYSVAATVVDSNYTGSTTGSLVISIGAATVALGNLSPTYDGTSKAATATTTPNGLTVNLTYNGSSTAPVNAGSYTVIGTISDSSYQGSDTSIMIISKASAAVWLGNLSTIYNGSAQSVTDSTAPTGLTINLTYNGSSTMPTTAGTYSVVATVVDSNYQGSDSEMFTISKATAGVTLDGLASVYDGASKSVVVSTTPSGLTVNVTYNDSSTAPVNAGSYSVVATIVDSNYAGTASGSLVIAKATAGITLDSLTTIYDRTSKPAVVSTTPSGLIVNVTYNDSSSAPVNAGSYSVVATVVDSNYQGSTSGTMTITKATASVSLGNLGAIYNGSEQQVSDSTTPSGLTVDLTYNGSSTTPTLAGTYSVVATIVDSNYQGSTSGMMTIAKAAASVSLSNLAAIYNGSAQQVSDSTAPSGLTVDLTYNGSSTTPTLAGTYSVFATIVDSNYQGSTSGMMTIAKAAASVSLSNLAAIYNGSAQQVSDSTAPSGLTVDLTYNGSSTTPTLAGTYSVVATVVDSNYQGSTSGMMTIAKAAASVSLSNLAAIYNGSAQQVSDSTAPSGLTVDLTYNGSSTTPMLAGTYSVVATVVDSNYQGSTSGMMTIAKATASVSLSNLDAVYNGSAQQVSDTTTPSGLTVDITYNGSSTTPTLAGTYSVVAIVVDSNYQGNTSGTMTIAKATASVSLSNLAAVYNGSAQQVNDTTTPSGLTVDLTYNGSSTTPTLAGTYSVVATVVDSNYQGSTSGMMTIAKAAASVSLSNLAAIYNGSAQQVSDSTAPSGLTVDLTYNGSSTMPTLAGTYSVVAIVVDSNYQGNTSGTFVITMATATVNIDSLFPTYDGTAKSPYITTTPGGLAVSVTYNDSSTVPVNAGHYTVMATIVDSNYTGASSANFYIVQATATLSIDSLNATYDGSPKTVVVTITPDTLPYRLTYADSLTPPTNVGTYEVVANVTDPNWQGGTYGFLQIAKATATISLDSNSLAAVYDGTSKHVTVTTNPSGLNVAVTYNDSSSAPVNAGYYTVMATIVDGNYTGASSANFYIAQATATLSIDSLNATYDGSPKAVVVTITPDTLPYRLTYADSLTPPTNVGTYEVVANVTDPNWQGGTYGFLQIAKATATISLDSNSLAAVYDGTSKHVTVTTNPSGLNVAVTYNGSSTLPTNAGSYSIIATINDSNYVGSISGTLTIAKATASVFIDFGSLSAVYDGTGKQVLTATSPTGLYVDVIYNGSASAPVSVGSYIVVASVNDSNYTGSVTDTMIIAKATASVFVDFGSLSATYDGTGKQVLTATSPTGLNVDVTYNGLPTAPVNAGSYTVVATVNDSNYTGSVIDTMIIAKATASVEIDYGSLFANYDGSAQQVLTATVPSGLTLDVTYNGSSTVPTNAGIYTVVATINDSNYQGSLTDTLIIAKGVATILLSNLNAVYTGSSIQATATITSSSNSLPVDITYDGLSTFPVNAGKYAVVATVVDSNYQGIASDTLFIAKASAAISFGNLDFMYDGSAKAASATTTPSGLNVDYTYNGSSTAPTAIGTYSVVATINETNYSGSDTAAMVITITTGIEEQSSLSDVKLYPNPTTDYILVTAPAAIRKITVLNLNGASILVKENCAQQEKLNIGSLSKGAYFIEVETSTGKSTHRIILN